MAANSAQPCRVVADHAPERVGEAGADREDQDDLQEGRERRRVLERMRRVGVEEPAAVRAELLDRLLRGHRPLRDRLRRALDGRDAACSGSQFWTTPCETNTSAATNESGSST